MISGIALPIITPFKDGNVDFEEYTNILNYYIAKGLKSVIPMGTTGESFSLSKEEKKELIRRTIDIVRSKADIYFGISGNITSKIIEEIKEIEEFQFKGFLITPPYYIKPTQKEIEIFYKDIAESTEKDIIIYNIPYRTGVNIENETIVMLSQIDNIVGVKDCCGNLDQSLELSRMKPQGFSLLTGEDKYFYYLMASGYDGGVLATAHIFIDDYHYIYKNIEENNHFEALLRWNNIAHIIPSFFKETNPGPVKYMMFLNELIKSYETRKPICGVTEKLKDVLKIYKREIDELIN